MLLAELVALCFLLVTGTRLPVAGGTKEEGWNFPETSVMEPTADQVTYVHLSVRYDVVERAADTSNGTIALRFLSRVFASITPNLQNDTTNSRVAPRLSPIVSSKCLPSKLLTNGCSHFPGPTLVVVPGGRLQVRVTNDLLPASIRNEFHTHHPANMTNMHRFHRFNFVNIHTHGLHVDPKVDSPFLDIDPGTSHEYVLDIPADHPPGLHWYHAHVHGSTALQVMGGLVGAILVEPLRKGKGVLGNDRQSLVVVVQFVNLRPHRSDAACEDGDDDFDDADNDTGDEGNVSETRTGKGSRTVQARYNSFKPFSMPELERHERTPLPVVSKSSTLRGLSWMTPIFSSWNGDEESSGAGGDFLLVNGELKRGTIEMELRPNDSLGGSIAQRNLQILFASGFGALSLTLVRVVKPNHGPNHLVQATFVPIQRSECDMTPLAFDGITVQQTGNMGPDSLEPISSVYLGAGNRVELRIQCFTRGTFALATTSQPARPAATTGIGELRETLDILMYINVIPSPNPSKEIKHPVRKPREADAKNPAPAPAEIVGSVVEQQRPWYHQDLRPQSLPAEVESLVVRWDISFAQGSSAAKQCGFQIGQGLDCSDVLPRDIVSEGKVSNPGSLDLAASPLNRQCPHLLFSGPKGEDRTKYPVVFETGSIVEFRIFGTGSRITLQEQHPFHLHVHSFQLIDFIPGPAWRNSSKCRGEGVAACSTRVLSLFNLKIGDWRDTIPSLNGIIVVRFAIDQFSGETALHCHTLTHEDRGMMTSILVVPRGELQPSLSESYLRSKTQIGSSPPSVEAEQSAEKESYVRFSRSTLFILIILAVVAAVYYMRLKSSSPSQPIRSTSV